MRKLLDPEGNAFEFRISDDHRVNQRRYESLGEGITQFVYELMEGECHLQRFFIPAGRSFDPLVEGGEDPRGFFYASEGAFSTTDRLLILVHGSGVVRAGQWARRIIVNDNLESGTQLPYIRLAREAGYEVIVLNTNHNAYTDKDGRRQFITGSEDPESHAQYVWRNYVEHRVRARHIAFVAHSYGGVVVSELACNCWPEFARRVFAVAMTDSVHSLDMLACRANVDQVRRFYREHACNWVSSDRPLDTPVREGRYDAAKVSAGTPSHEWTSDKSKSSVFVFLDAQYQIRINPQHQTEGSLDQPECSSTRKSHCTTL